MQWIKHMFHRILLLSGKKPPSISDDIKKEKEIKREAEEETKEAQDRVRWIQLQAEQYGLIEPNSNINHSKPHFHN